MAFTNTFAEGQHRGGFIRSELSGYGSRDVVTVKSGEVLLAGQVVGRITTGGKIVKLAPVAADGSQNAAGILFDNIDATGADKVGAVMIARSAEVNDCNLVDDAPALNVGFRSAIVWPAGITAPQKAAAIAQLLVLGISVRTEVG